MTFDILQIIIGIALIFVAFKLMKKVTKVVFFILIIAGIYSFSKGLIDVGIILQWWNSLNLF